MNSIIQELFVAATRNAFYVVASTLLLSFLVAKLRIESIRLQRWAWGGVLLQGGLIFGMSWVVPIDASYSRKLTPFRGKESIDQKVLEETSDAFRSTTLQPLIATNDEASNEPGDIQSDASEFSMVASESAVDPFAVTTIDSASSKQTDDQVLSPLEHATFTKMHVERLVLLLGWCWLIGAALLVAHAGVMWTMLQWSILRDGRAARQEWTEEWHRLLEGKTRRRVAMVEHEVLGPMLMATLRGTQVVVPSDLWEELSADQRLAILQHELAHLARGDIWWSLLGRLLALPQWFNPFAWQALKRFDACAEFSCDDYLRRARPDLVAEYAKALLAMVEFPHRVPFAARAVQGSEIGCRVRRLLVPIEREETMFRRICFGTVLVGLIAFGFLRWELVERSVAIPFEADPSFTDADVSPGAADEQDERIDTLIATLNLQNDPQGLHAKLKAALATDPGLLVLGERVAIEENNLRQQAEQDAAPIIIAEVFDKQGDRYVVKPERSGYPAAFFKDWSTCESSAAALRPGFRQLAAKIQDPSEAGQLLKRFLTDETAATLVYLDHVRNRVDPDYQTLRDRFNERLVVGRDERLRVRPGAHGAIEEELRQLERASKFAKRIHRGLEEWRKDLSETESVAVAVREATGDPVFSEIVALGSLNDDYGLEQRIDELFESLESVFIDRADGLVPADDRVDEVRQQLEAYRRVKRFSDKLRSPVQELTAHLNYDDPLVDRWGTLLQSGMGLTWLASTSEFAEGSPVDVASEFLAEWTTADDTGNVTVKSDRQEEVTNQVREWLRASRNIRRRGAELDSIATQIDPPELSRSYQSFAGKCLVARAARNLVHSKHYDGLGRWLETHFDFNDNGYSIKEGHQAEIEDFLQQLDNVRSELANNDF